MLINQTRRNSSVNSPKPVEEVVIEAIVETVTQTGTIIRGGPLHPDIAIAWANYSNKKYPVLRATVLPAQPKPGS